MCYIKNRLILRLIILWTTNSKPPNVFEYRHTHIAHSCLHGPPSCPQIRVIIILARYGSLLLITSIPAVLFVALRVVTSPATISSPGIHAANQNPALWESHTSETVLPSPRFSRAIGLVLDLFRGKIIAVAVCGFLGYFLCTCRYFWASFKSGGFTSCATLRTVLFYVS